MRPMRLSDLTRLSGRSAKFSARIPALARATGTRPLVRRPLWRAICGRSERSGLVPFGRDTELLFLPGGFAGRALHGGDGDVRLFPFLCGGTADGSGKARNGRGSDFKQGFLPGNADRTDITTRDMPTAT